MENHKKLICPSLPYAYDALEPILSSEILKTHHQKHHQGYVNKYNNLLEKLLPALTSNNTIELQKHLKSLDFFIGGHNCHSLYWQNLAPKGLGGGEPLHNKSLLLKKINETWGNMENFKNDFNTKTASVKGSGWGWLAFDNKTKNLSIELTLGQDNVYIAGKTPLLTVDVWEHAYYLQYKNLRGDYLKRIWEVVNLKVVEERYLKCVM